MERFEWSTADIMQGRMFVAGPRLAKFCPFCDSPNVETGIKNYTEWLRCRACGIEVSGAGARA